MHSIGQLSLEYLLLLAAVLAIFAMLLPLLNSVYATSLFGLDSLNARNFASSLQAAIEEMSFQADGSAILVEARPLSNWIVSLAGERLLVSVQGPEESKKQFEVLFPNKAGNYTLSLSSKTLFLLKKQSGKVRLEYH